MDLDAPKYFSECCGQNQHSQFCSSESQRHFSLPRTWIYENCCRFFSKDKSLMHGYKHQNNVKRHNCDAVSERYIVIVKVFRCPCFPHTCACSNDFVKYPCPSTIASFTTICLNYSNFCWSHKNSPSFLLHSTAPLICQVVHKNTK